MKPHAARRLSVRPPEGASRSSGRCGGFRTEALTPAARPSACVGANGAGKSTLLKVLWRAPRRRPEGAYRLNDGRVASLLELGAGFHMEFTGRANIMMNGVMMGYTRREMESKMDEVIDFAELGPYIDEPVRTYSSGMGLRLGFSVAVAVDPEILIIDEVFAVGDMYFQKKCIDKIYEFKKRNKTILFCSHSLYDVRQLCDDAVWLDHGETKAHRRLGLRDQRVHRFPAPLTSGIRGRT